MNAKTVTLILAGLLALAAGLGAEEQPSQEEEREFVVAYSPQELVLDPLHIYTTMGSELSTALYEGLVTYHPFSLEPIPGVASRWETRSGGKVYRFYLRQEALYSNGDPVLAGHFKDSWLRILDPAANAEYSFLFDIILGARAYRTGDKKAELGIRVVSERVLEVELQEPAAHFLKLLGHLSFAPIHPSYLKKPGWETAPTLIGNGPFYILKRSPQELVLEKNNLYWDQKRVELDRIKIRFMEDAAAISRDFNLGKIHWANNWDLSELEDRESLVFNPMFATSYFYFVCAQPPWNDARVRLALARLLPWGEIRSNRLVFPTSRLIPPIPSYPEVEGIPSADFAQARALLEEAGFPEGKGLPPLIIKVAENSGGEEIAGTMAEHWRKQLNLEVRIHHYPYNRYLDEVKKPDYTLGSATWIGDYADPLTFLQMWTKDSNLNDARFVDVQFNQLIDASMGEQGTDRYERLGEAEGILLSQAVVLPINHTPALNLIDLKRVEGWFPNVLDLHPFKYIRFKAYTLPPGVARIPQAGTITPGG